MVYLWRISTLLSPDIDCLRITLSSMPKRKMIHPFRKGYRSELPYPSRRGKLLLPTHGSGPRCRVEHNPSDDGPWSTLQIMRVDEDRDQVEVEEYTCAVPRYYAVPLILMNKRLAFFEASCHPDGTPLTLPVSHPTPTAININPDNDNDRDDGVDGRGVVMVTQCDLPEYSYLWRLRTRFLQAIFDMNHQRRLDERWRYDPIHGFVHRLYRRYGHDVYQRAAYWRDEINAARVPYATPDIADMGVCFACPLSHIHPLPCPALPVHSMKLFAMKAWPAASWRTRRFHLPMRNKKINRINCFYAAPPDPWGSGDCGQFFSFSFFLLFFSFLILIYLLFFFFFPSSTQRWTDVRSLDWDAHILEDMAAGARINTFLWNRVSQGYSRVVTDDPPQEGWRAWRRCAADHLLFGGGDDDSDAAREQKTALFRTPACTPTPVRELPSGIIDSDAVTNQQTRSQLQSQLQSPRYGYGGRRDIRRALADASAAVIESTSASGAAPVAAAARDDDVETIDSMNHEEVLTVALDGPQPAHVWQLPFPASEQSSKAASQGTTSTSCRGRRRPTQVMLDFDVPKEMRLTVIHCTFSHVDDVGEDPSRAHKPSLTVVMLNPFIERDLKVVYASRVS